LGIGDPGVDHHHLRLPEGQRKKSQHQIDAGVVLCVSEKTLLLFLINFPIHAYDETVKVSLTFD